jgi:hypothetical protein
MFKLNIKQPKQAILDLPKPDNPVVHHQEVKSVHLRLLSPINIFLGAMLVKKNSMVFVSIVYIVQH